jgi:hypothetical protein
MLRLATILNKKINVIKKLTDDESILIKFHFDRIHWLRKKLLQPVQVIKIHDEIKEAILSNKTENSHRLISEIFTNFRAFLDYWETNIKHDFGKDSMQIKAFKNATHLEYDNIFAYRFIYELRNYIQHCGMPEITVKKYLDENDNAIISLNLNTKSFLECFDCQSIGHRFDSDILHLTIKELRIYFCDSFLFALTKVLTFDSQLSFSKYTIA